MIGWLSQPVPSAWRSIPNLLLRIDRALMISWTKVLCKDAAYGDILSTLVICYWRRQRHSKVFRLQDCGTDIITFHRFNSHVYQLVWPYRLSYWSSHASPSNKKICLHEAGRERDISSAAARWIYRVRSSKDRGADPAGFSNRSRMYSFNTPCVKSHSVNCKTGRTAVRLHRLSI